MAIMAYKLPPDLSVDEFISTVDALNAPLGINPVQDINDDWFISEQEWNYPEWQIFKIQYPEITANFVYTEYVPNPKYIVNI
jgi:hypothetical protein